MGLLCECFCVCCLVCVFLSHSSINSGSLSLIYSRQARPYPLSFTSSGTTSSSSAWTDLHTALALLELDICYLFSRVSDSAVAFSSSSHSFRVWRPAPLTSDEHTSSMLPLLILLYSSLAPEFNADIRCSDVHFTSYCVPKHISAFYRGLCSSLAEPINGSGSSPASSPLSLPASPVDSNWVDMSPLEVCRSQKRFTVDFRLLTVDCAVIVVAFRLLP